MKPLRTFLLLTLLLVAPAFGHGGEEHADLREAEAHQAATAATGPQKSPPRKSSWAESGSS